MIAQLRRYRGLLAGSPGRKKACASVGRVFRAYRSSVGGGSSVVRFTRRVSVVVACSSIGVSCA